MSCWHLGMKWCRRRENVMLRASGLKTLSIFMSDRRVCRCSRYANLHHTVGTHGVGTQFHQAAHGHPTSHRHIIYIYIYIYRCSWRTHLCMSASRDACYRVMLPLTLTRAFNTCEMIVVVKHIITMLCYYYYYYAINMWKCDIGKSLTGKYCHMYMRFAAYLLPTFTDTG